ncbi:MAG TPA: DUF1080 domain-containing protein [Bacteroidales bacterium]|nr:DUF1080 domain-containing protein [Bacteroidales bacterium]
MKNIKSTLMMAVILLVAACTPNTSKENTADNNEWQSLFNGKNLDDWTVKISHHEMGDNFANTFRVKDGKILVSYDDYDKFDNQFGHMFYKDPFSSYHLRLEYRFTNQDMDDAPDYAYRNSGVMFHAQAPNTMTKDQDWPIAIEYQILADADDGNPRPTGNVCTPGTDIDFHNEMYPGHCLNSDSKTYKWDQWVTGDLIVYGDSLIIHMVNGDTVLQYSKPRMGGGVVTRADSTIYIPGKALKNGYIALQSEGSGIEFRNIQIKKLD